MQLNPPPPEPLTCLLTTSRQAFHLACQSHEGLISRLPLISLFTALRVNADSERQQAAVKHVINTALAVNETLLLGLLREPKFCDELCQSQLTCCVPNGTQIIFLLPLTLVIFSPTKNYYSTPRKIDYLHK